MKKYLGSGLQEFPFINCEARISSERINISHVNDHLSAIGNSEIKFIFSFTSSPVWRSQIIGIRLEMMFSKP